MGTKPFPIRPDSDAVGDWNRWLTKNGYPPLEAIADRNSAGEWGLPGRRPPSDEASIDAMLSHKWARVFLQKAKGRTHA